MKFKLDENLGTMGQTLLQEYGHDVMTVSEQALSGASDDVLYRVCSEERRVLVTLDHDFGQTLRFPPEGSAGIAVLECRGRLSPTLVMQRMRNLAELLKSRSIDGELWIVEATRARIHTSRSTS
jgi:predicted nuclease of predicted toxin-antitoxin system